MLKIPLDIDPYSDLNIKKMGIANLLKEYLTKCSIIWNSTNANRGMKGKSKECVISKTFSITPEKRGVQRVEYST